jgi:hypothetical protein
METKEKLMRLFISLLVLCSGFFASGASAALKNYGNLLADLPSEWVCQLEGNDHVCLNTTEGDLKTSAVVITVRAKGVEDSLTFFRDQLTRPKTIELQGLPVLSQVRQVREMKINNQTWIEGIHQNSELSGYITHYLVTTDSLNSALISVSIHQDLYQSTIPKLAGFINSLKLLSDSNSKSDATIPNLGSATTVASPRMVEVMGIKIKRTYAVLGVGLLLVIGLLGYAILSD